MSSTHRMRSKKRIHYDTAPTLTDMVRTVHRLLMSPPCQYARRDDPDLLNLLAIRDRLEADLAVEQLDQTERTEPPSLEI